MTTYIKKYGKDVKIEFTLDEYSIVVEVVVFNSDEYYKSGWNEYLKLKFEDGRKLVNKSTGVDWKFDFNHLSDIMFAQSEAFYSLGEDFNSLLIEDLMEV